MASIFAAKEAPKRAIVAAAHTVNLDSSEDARRSVGMSEPWQGEIADLFRSVGQIKHGALLKADILSKVHFYIGEVQADPKDSPVPTENVEAKAPLERLRTFSEGLPTLVRRQELQGITVGECYLIGLGRRTASGEPIPESDVTSVGRERWFIASIKEVRGSDPVKVRDPDDPQKEIDLMGPKKAKELGVQPDFIARLWQRDLMDGFKADSPMRGIIQDAKEYVLFGKTVRAVARTRLTSAGLFLIPDELSLEPIEGMPEGMDPFLQTFIQGALATMADESNASSAIPPVVRGAAEYLKEVRHLTVERPLDRLWMELREKAIEHMAQGMSLPVELTTGLGEANHWGGGEIQASAFAQYYKPDLEWIATSWTNGYLWPSYDASQFDGRGKYVVWYDASAIVKDGERADNALEAHRRDLISDATAREALGFTDDDAADETELAARAERKRANNPIQPKNPDPNALPEEPETVTASAEIDLGAQLVEIDRGLQERLEGAADIAMEQVLERAGNKLKSRAQRDKALTASINGVKPKSIAATIGRTKAASLASVDELLADAWVDLEDRFERWIASAQDQVLTLVPGLKDIEKQEAQAEQARARRDAWKWLASELDNRTIEVLYSPSQNGSLTQVIREALGRAGGG